jgi:hypothetical protein
MRLVDADKSKPYFDDHLDDNGVVAAMNAIEEMPTVDAEPVRHGRWIPYYEPMECFVDVYLNTEIRDVQVGWICSECGRHEQHSAVEEMPYCHCGAKMDAEVKHEE